MKDKEEIIKNEDIEALFLLEDNEDFSIILWEILTSRYNKNTTSLNDVEMNLFLCINLENAGQADSILTFLQEWFPNKHKEIVNALNEIGAVKSSDIIKKAIKLLPKNGSWFFDSADEKSIQIMEQLDKEFSDYPDGLMADLYRRYAVKYKTQMLKNKKQ